MRPAVSIVICSSRSGLAGVWVAVALVALAGSAALVIDLGSLVVAAQRCQDVADSAALAAGTKLPYEQVSRTSAVVTAAANNTEGGWPVVCRPEDCEHFSGPGVTVDGIELGPYADLMRVRVRAPVHYTFGRILGIGGATAVRSASVLRAPVNGIPLCPMWIAANTDIGDDLPPDERPIISLLMADGPHCADIPGSFGFLQSPPGCTATGFELLQADDLTREDIETSFVYRADEDAGTPGSTLWADTGVDVGSFRKALERDQGHARLERAEAGWPNDPWWAPKPDNPRIMLIPMVNYLGGTGSNASFEIVRFAAFWLVEVHGGQKIIDGRFIWYDLPGGDPNSTLEQDSGIYATKLVR